MYLEVSVDFSIVALNKSNFGLVKNVNEKVTLCPSQSIMRIAWSYQIGDDL